MRHDGFEHGPKLLERYILALLILKHYLKHMALSQNSDMVSRLGNVQSGGIANDLITIWLRNLHRLNLASIDSALERDSRRGDDGSTLNLRVSLTRVITLRDHTAGPWSNRCSSTQETGVSDNIGKPSVGLIVCVLFIQVLEGLTGRAVGSSHGLEVSVDGLELVRAKEMLAGLKPVVKSLIKVRQRHDRQVFRLLHNDLGLSYCLGFLNGLKDGLFLASPALAGNPTLQPHFARNVIIQRIAQRPGTVRSLQLVTAEMHQVLHHGVIGTGLRVHGVLKGSKNLVE
ncbi:hypothetical protein HG530_001220 [Fusarium avenaceum]|nr:hypothetical protein HG530_001220 [Fusarium avenaceum]